MSSTEPRDPRSPEPSQTEFEFPVTGLNEHNELSRLGRRRASSSSSSTRSGRHRLRGPGPTGERFAPSPSCASEYSTGRRVRVRAPLSPLNPLSPLSPQSHRLEIAPEAFGPTPWEDRSWEQDAIRAAAPSELARHAGIAEFAITLLATLAFGLGWAAFELGGERAGEPGDRIGIDGWRQHTARGGSDGSVYAGAARGAIGAPVNAGFDSRFDSGFDSAIRLDDDLNGRGTTEWTTGTTTARMPKLIGSPRTSSDVNNSNNSSELGPAGAKSKP